MTAETCQICGKTKNVTAAGHCQGHENPSSSKQRLDAIRSAGAGRSVITEEAPGLSLKEQLDAIPAPAANASPVSPASPAPASVPPLGAAGVKKGPGSILGRKTGAGTDDISAIKSQLDAIPAPAVSGAQPEVAGVPKDLLDSIPTPKVGGSPIPKNVLDSIPSPGVGAAAAPAASSGPSMAELLNSIPTPAVASGGPAPAEKPQGEVPEWQRNFEKHQAAISASIVAQGGQAPAGGYAAGAGGYGTPDMVPASYASRGTEAPPQQGSAYTMVIGVVILICLAMFGYLMFNKPTPAVMPSEPSMSTPSSSMPSTPTTPVQSVPFTPPTQSLPSGIPQAMPTQTLPSGIPQTMPTQSVPAGIPQAMPQAVPQQMPVNSTGMPPGVPMGNNQQTGNNP